MDNKRIINLVKMICVAELLFTVTSTMVASLALNRCIPISRAIGEMPSVCVAFVFTVLCSYREYAYIHDCRKDVYRSCCNRMGIF